MCIFVASTNGKIVLHLGFKEKNVVSQDLLILQQIFLLLWDKIVLEAKALKFYGIFEIEYYRNISRKNEIEYS